MKNYQLLEWDSQFFGYPVVRITKEGLTEDELKAELETLKKEGVRLVYWFFPKVKAELMNVAERIGGIKVDCKVTYQLTLPSQSVSDVAPEIQSFLHQSLTPEIVQLAQESGRYSRFHLDPHFGEEKYNQLYEEWIRKSVSGIIADDVLVFYLENKVVGLITLAIKEEEGKIGLLAVNSEYRGQAIGTKLMDAAIQRCREKGGKQMLVATQEDNKPANAFYEKMGFSIKNEEYVYHFWL